MDRYLIDTSSLLSLVRYYRPFDKNKKLFQWLKGMFMEKQQCLLIENVLKEANRINKGQIVKTYDFLKEVKCIKSIAVIPPQFHERIDKNWIVSEAREKVKPEEYKESKHNELGRADWQLVFAAREKKGDIIVTEESRKENDNKLFKKSH